MSLLAGLFATVTSAQHLDLEFNELIAIEDIARECLDSPVLIDSNGGTGSRAQNTYGIIFQPHESSDVRTMQYLLQLDREPGTGDWTVRKAGVFGQQFIGDAREPVRISGDITAADAEHVHGMVEQYWVEQVNRGRLEISSIASSAEPELHCEYARVLPRNTATFIEVIARSDAVPYHTPPAIEQNGVQVRAFTGADGGFHFTLRRDGMVSPPVITNVDCAGMPNTCDPQVLEILTIGLGNPAILAEREKRRAAVLAVLPPAYDESAIRDIQPGSRDGDETLLSNLAPLDISENRRLSATIHCRRSQGSQEDWQCSYNPGSYNQTLSHGGMAIVQAMTLTESQVEDLADTISLEVGGFRMMMVSGNTGNTDIQVMVFGDSGRSYEMIFDQELELVSVQNRN